MRDILSRSQLFAQLDEQGSEEVARAASRRQVDRGELVFQQGDEAYAFFLVATGKVKVFKMSPEGKEQILMIAGPGESFAEAALFAGGKFPASAQALEDTDLVVIDRVKFVAMIGRHPDIAVSLIARLSVLLRKMTSLVEELSLTDVTTRLAHYLYERMAGAENAGSAATSAKPTITLSVKKSVLASQLGTIPETLSRSFSRLTREQVISIDGPRVQILDPRRLKELAGAD